MPPHSLHVEGLRPHIDRGAVGGKDIGQRHRHVLTDNLRLEVLAGVGSRSSMCVSESIRPLCGSSRTSRMPPSRNAQRPATQYTVSLATSTLPETGQAESN